MKKSPTQEKVVAYLTTTKTNPPTALAVAEALGITKDAAQKALQRLWRAGIVDRSDVRNTHVWVIANVPEQKSVIEVFD